MNELDLLLIERAALAAGIVTRRRTRDYGQTIVEQKITWGEPPGKQVVTWSPYNPLDNDGESFRLLVKLSATDAGGLAEARRDVVRAAAERPPALLVAVG